MKSREVSLLVFLRGSSNHKDRMPGCANYDRLYGGCLVCWCRCEDKEHCRTCPDYEHYSKCQIEIGRRCAYFEKAVLPTAKQIGQLERLEKIYRKRAGFKSNERLNIKKAVRKCPGLDGNKCDAELIPRMRLCDDCREKKNRANKRKWKQEQTG